MLGSETLDDFRFAIGPENIDTPARAGIFPRHESWSLLGHPSNMRLWRPGSSQLSCHNQTDPLPKGRWWVAFKTDPKKIAPEGKLRLHRVMAGTASWVPRVLGMVVGHFFFPKTGALALSVSQPKKS